MDPKMTEEIFKRLDIIGSKMQVGAGFMWQAVLKRAYAEGIVDSAFGVLLLIIGILCWKTANDEYSSEEGSFRLLALAAWFFSVVFLYSGIVELYAPEFYAFKLLLSAVK